MGDIFAAASVTSSGRPVLVENEVECNLLSNVDLEPEDDTNSFIPLKSGVLILTTHRLLWLSSAKAVGIPLSAITHIFSSKRSIKSVFHSPRFRFQLSAAVITAVVRGKGDWELFLTKLWECWRARAWENTTSVSSETISSSSGSGGGFYGSDGSVRMVGVAGILRKEQQMWESTDKSLQEAFQDLNALMSITTSLDSQSKAKEMVMLAEKMRQKLLSASSSTNQDEMGSKEEIQDWLLSVGIASPVTKESAGALYHQQLARQLADFVRIPLERAGGMINLIDIYCLFNRARGTALISPEDLLLACSLWEKFDVPVMLRKFDSGVMVIQNKAHSDEEVIPFVFKLFHFVGIFSREEKGGIPDWASGLPPLLNVHVLVFARIRILVTKPEALRTGISATDAAMTLGIAPAMAKENLLTAESKGFLCRDISPDGFRFYVNLFPEISPNDLYLVKDHGIYGTWVRAASVSG
ncbi:hypothetical protein JRO89_XS14G0118500 [Xanthoceras sorbifolium]|uniref:Vacuolar protein-sorting-associated protein 36 n=1 Tax=Xanthoceras sorbifolium TaxID=99658 RepID=A0ABQ8H548_9ROSI|nr:hypothetical protein JRO89_XS14G0118500 [Xanthoceras sorbifolium]